jgi:hypothetical protein
MTPEQRAEGLGSVYERNGDDAAVEVWRSEIAAAIREAELATARRMRGELEVAIAQAERALSAGLAELVAAEREGCAAAAEAVLVEMREEAGHPPCCDRTGERIAAAIRARTST